MNILFLSEKGEHLSLAFKMSKEGHKVTTFIKNNPVSGKTDENLYLVDSWRPELKTTDFVVCDGEGFGFRTEDISALGKPVLCASKASDLFNIMFFDKGISLLKKHGLNFEEIENGLAMKAHIFFNGRHFIKPIFYSFEEDGNVVVASSRPNRIKEDILKKIEPILVKARYRGLVNIDFEINDLDYSIKSVYLGLYDIVDTLKEALDESLVDVLFEVASGIKRRIKIRRDYLITIPITFPQLPYSSQINGICDKNTKHIALNSVTVTDDKTYYCNSLNKRVLSVTARGESIVEAQRRAYRTIGNIMLHGCNYRRNVGDSAKSKWQKLQEIAFL